METPFSIKITYSYDATRKPVKISDNGKVVVEYSYYEDGNLRQVKFANGIYTEYIYNADKNYKNIPTKTADGDILLDYSYQYDENGNRIKKVGSDSVKKIEENDSSIGTTAYPRTKKPDKSKFIRNYPDGQQHHATDGTGAVQDL